MKLTITFLTLALLACSCKNNGTGPSSSSDIFTAGERLAAVTAQAQSAYAGARLIRVSAASVDTTGRAPQWNYCFVDTGGLHPFHYFHVTRTQVTFDSTSPALVGPSVVTTHWFDSDSALIFGQRYVGSQYCSANPNHGITANLGQSMTPNAHAVWTILYSSSTTITSGILIDGTTGDLVGQTR